MNFALCTNFFSFDILKIFFKCSKKNIIKKSPIEEVVEEINELIENKDFDNEFLFCHILNKCIQITGSEYGFMGEIMFDSEHDQHYLQTYSITNIAWNHSSSQFFRKYIDNDLKFFNLRNTLFGKPFYTKKPNIVNSYDINRDILPSGHPKIKRFLGVPLVIQDKPIYIIGLCNKRSNYTKKDVKMIEKILSLASFLYLGKFGLNR